MGEADPCSSPTEESCGNGLTRGQGSTEAHGERRGEVDTQGAPQKLGTNGRKSLE